jgi:hypothetical protein
MTKRSRVGCAGILGAAGAMVGVSGASAQTCAQNGVPQVVAGETFSNWQERATLVLTNAVRTAPVDFRNFYLPSAPTILQPAAYPAVSPVQWSVALNRSSRAHSADMAATPCFQHDSCNGTAWSSRIAAYYAGYTALGENIAAGQSDPLAAMTAWLLDSTGGVPAIDRGGGDGHRSNLMSSSYTQIGCGYAAGGPYGRYWTQDFGRPGAAATVCSSIASASHIKQGTSINFLANYYSAGNTAPQSASVVINGVSTPMAVHLGTAARGTYRLSTAAGTTCRSYHFEFRDSTGALARYPATGELRTYGEGNCGEDYVAGSINTCRVDFDGSGTVTSADIFAFMNAWLLNDARTDFNGSGSLSTQDIFDFLSAWFVGC